MSLFMSTMHPFNFKTRDKAEKGETKAEIWEKQLLMKADRHFSPVETAFAKQGALGNSVLPETSLKKSPPDRRNRDLA